KTFEIDPVVLILAGRRKLLAGDVDVAADQRCRLFPVVHAGQLGHHALALLTTFGALDLRLHTRRCAEQPGLIVEDTHARLGPGFDLEPALHPVKPDDAPDQDAPTGFGHAQAACCLPASFTSAATLSLSCAPLPTHSLTRSTFSSRRLSLPAATGL